MCESKLFMNADYPFDETKTMAVELRQAGVPLRAILQADEIVLTIGGYEMRTSIDKERVREIVTVAESQMIEDNGKIEV